jgi:hypothetical protein
MNQELGGRGASLPLTIGATGGIREAAGAAKIEQSIRVILGTTPGERLMRPSFGCNLRSLVFSPNNETTANLARHYVEEALRRWEPRIELLNVHTRSGPGANAVEIGIEYRIRETDEFRVLVYPFALEPPLGDQRPAALEVA